MSIIYRLKTGIYSFKNKYTGETAKFKIGQFPHGWSRKYKLLGSKYRIELLEMKKPTDVPHFVRWSNYNSSAYFDGRLYMNEDSTMALITGQGPPLSKELKRRLIE